MIQAYKLITTYPYSPEMGTVVVKNDDGDWIDDKGNTYDEKILKNYPNWKRCIGKYEDTQKWFINNAIVYCYRLHPESDNDTLYAILHECEASEIPTNQDDLFFSSKDSREIYLRNLLLLQKEEKINNVQFLGMHETRSQYMISCQTDSVNTHYYEYIDNTKQVYIHEDYLISLLGVLFKAKNFELHSIKTGSGKLSKSNFEAFQLNLINGEEVTDSHSIELDVSHVYNFFNAIEQNAIT